MTIITVRRNAKKTASEANHILIKRLTCMLIDDHVSISFAAGSTAFRHMWATLTERGRRSSTSMRGARRCEVRAGWRTADGSGE
eukprot:scaffold83626_cov28-Cyclotella_meneghiniana.AAC.1